MQLLSVANQEYVPTFLSCFCSRSKTTRNDILQTKKTIDTTVTAYVLSQVNQL